MYVAVNKGLSSHERKIFTFVTEEFEYSLGNEMQ